MPRYAFKFRGGSYFVDVSRPAGGRLDEALTFKNEEYARTWLNKFAPWVWARGGMIVSVDVFSDEVFKAMSHPDTQIPEALLAVVTRWIRRVINDYKISDRKLEDAEGAELLRCVLGDDVTFGLLRGLTGDMVLAEARAVGVRVPRNVEGVFTAFARTWSPEIARCSACELPALHPYPDRSGLEVLREGTVCPWCGEGIVRVVRFRSTLTNWVTGGEVALDTKYDVSVRGARLPLQEDELRGKIREDLRELLDREGVPVHLWLRYLVAEGHQDFGLPRAPLVILASLGSDAVMQHGPQVVAAHVLAAKRSAERPSVVAISS